MSTELLLKQLASSSNPFIQLTASSSESQTSSNDLQSTITETDESKLESLLLPALIGHEALPIHLKVLFDAILPSYSSDLIDKVLSKSGWTINDFQRGYILQSSSDSLLSNWRCTNIVITHSILSIAKKYHRNMLNLIDSLEKSLTQTILVSLVNTNNSNPTEMPTIASLAPNNTSLHLDLTTNKKSSIIQSLSEQTSSNDSTVIDTKESIQQIMSPAKSEISSTTETESIKSINDGGRSSSIDINEQQQHHHQQQRELIKNYKNNKKRVQCEICYHTFCDKGALKIHTSSVHLREMHVCTVPGCNKQFPSKRSRNRHSNNPNMHTESGRRRNCRSVISPNSNIASTSTMSQISEPQHLQQQQQQEQQQSQITINPQILPLIQRIIMLNQAQSSIQPIEMKQDQQQQSQNIQLNQQTLNLGSILQNSNLLVQQSEIQNSIQIPSSALLNANIPEFLKLLLLQKQRFTKALC